MNNYREDLLSVHSSVLIFGLTALFSKLISLSAIGIISLYSYPVITVFLEPLFHGERPLIKDIISGLFVLFGIYLLVPEFSIDNQSTQGVLWDLLSALLFALRNIINRRYFKTYPAPHALFYQGLFVILLLTPFSVSVVSEVSLQQWLMLIILGVFFTALPHTLYANSLRHLKAKTVGLIASMQVIYGTLFAIIFPSELPNIQGYCI